MKANNNQKLREALLDIHALLGAYVRYEITAESLCLRIKDAINAALAAPPRNCDIHNGTGEAMRRYGFPTKSKPWTEADWVKFVDWIYDEAKGKHNGK